MIDKDDRLSREENSFLILKRSQHQGLNMHNSTTSNISKIINQHHLFSFLNFQVHAGIIIIHGPWQSYVVIDWAYF